VDWDYEALSQRGRAETARGALLAALVAREFECRELGRRGTALVAVRGALELEIWPRVVWVENPLWATERFILAPGLWACPMLLRQGHPPDLYLVPSQRWLEPDEVFGTRPGRALGPEWTIRMLRTPMPAELHEYELERMLTRLGVAAPVPGAVSVALQNELRRRARDEVGAVEAARWLHEAGVLKDSAARPGLPLRELLRAGAVEGAEQRPSRWNGRWFIRRAGAGSVAPLGQPYVRADEDATQADRDPFPIDPTIVERGTRSHARLQNALAEWVQAQGWDPRRPGPGEPQYDLAWEAGAVRWVAEVKSLTGENEERQLRLGLGQLLRYRHPLGETGEVRAALMIEYPPSDETWLSLCRELDVEVLWPERLRAGEAV
jgi:hypothetical protein